MPFGCAGNSSRGELYVATFVYISDKDCWF